MVLSSSIIDNLGGMNVAEINRRCIRNTVEKRLVEEMELLSEFITCL